ncbi:MAG: hypothetical protein AAGB16_02135 [Pseudomonadota bacterium]
MEKKSERFEIRLSHTDKQAFQSACDETGETPSDVIRRFIRRYIRRADADRLREGWSALRAMALRNRVKLSGCAAALVAVMVISLFANGGAHTFEQRSIAKPLSETATFTRFDTDNDGKIKPGDFGYEDELLFKVMDINASGAIDESEFRSRGTMAYIEVSLERFAPPIVHPTKPNCLAEIQPGHPLHMVTFDLRYPELRVVQRDQPQRAFYDLEEFIKNVFDFDRVVVWDSISGRPCYVRGVSHVAMVSPADLMLPED